jgi:hypothetical protein
MKSKIQEIENDNFILKYIKDQTNKGIGPFAICKYKNSNKISFKFNFDYMLSNFQNCELSFDISKNLILCYTPNNTVHKNILYIEEPMIKDAKIKNNFDINSFIEKIGNRKTSFDLIKYKISSELKFLIYIKILNIKKHLEYLNILFPLISDIDKFLKEYKNVLVTSEKNKDKYKTIKEFKILQNNVDNLIDKIKRKIIEFKNNINDNKPKFTFEIKGNNYIFKTKSNEYIFYLYQKQKLEIIIEKNNSLNINYTNPNNDIYITISEKNSINFQILNKLILYITDSSSFLGLILPQKNNQKTNSDELFGIERGKKYLYIGNIIKDNFSGFGLLITPFFCYKGKFSNSNKSDKDGLILFGEDNHFYKGGILGDELNGKGKYQNKKGIVIEGNFEKDDVKGICKFTFSNGDEYQGEMNGNIKSGEWNYINKINGKKMKVIFNNENNDVTYIY